MTTSRTDTHLLDDFVNRPDKRGDLQNRPTTRPLPDGWTWANLESVTENHDGRRVPVRKSDRVELQGQYPYYGASGIIDYVDDFIFQGDYLLLAEDGANLLSRSTPIAFQAHGKFWVNNHAHVIKTRHGMPLSYLEHYLNSIDLANYITGTAQPKLTQRNMNKIPVPLAPLAEQERIVAEIEKQFTRLDQAVASLRRLQTNLSRYKASVLKAACEGRLVPQDPNDEPADQLLQRILTERRTQWQATHPGKKYEEPIPVDPSYLSDLPKNWVWVRVEQLIRLIQYGTSDKASVENTGVPVLHMGNIQDGELDFGDLKYMPEDWDGIDKLLLEEGDVLFNRTNSAELVGKTAVYKKHHPKSTFASYLIRVQLIFGILPEFLSFYINSVFGRFYIASVVSQQVGQANVNGTKLANMPIPLPPLAEQHRIVAEVERRLSVITTLEQTITANLSRAERLRQSILHRAFTGQLV